MSPSSKHTEIHIELPEYAEETLQLLENAGFEAWIVGGFVRDSLLGRSATDIDIATNAHWRDVQTICENFGMKTYEIGVKHGTLTVVPPNADAIEITTYRADGKYTDGRHPNSVEFLNNIEEDLKRRDFTINAMAYHPTRGLLDPHSGMRDIQEKQIRIVGNPEKRFQEDALRILRACRFSSQLGFCIEESTYKAMVVNKYLLTGVSTERITHELDQLLMGDYVHDAIMQCVDTLAFVVPELVAMNGCEQITKWHMFDVLEHTAYAVQYCPKDRLVRWAAFAHDMGKPAAAFFSDDGVEHFYGHAKVSAKIAHAMTERLLMSQKFRADVKTLVLRHDDMIEPTSRSVRRAIARLDGRVDLFRSLLALKRADTMAHSAESASYIEVIEQLERVLEDVLESDAAFSVKDLEINGSDVLAIGIPEGPQVGQFLNAALDAVMDERVPNRRKELIEFLKSVEIA